MSHDYRVEENNRLPSSDDVRYVNVLLTRYPDWGSRLFRLFTGSAYSHASIGLSDTSDVYYSFVTKGFRVERPRKIPDL